MPSQLGKGCIIIVPKTLRADGNATSTKEVCDSKMAYAPEILDKFEAAKLTGNIRAQLVSVEPCKEGSRSYQHTFLRNRTQ